ncbi:MAG: hypothetical protein ACOVP1_13520 [Bacteroidia bacterium]
MNKWQINQSYQQLAGKVLISIFILATLFHVLVILEILPNEIVWGGNITFKEELYIFESISIAINLLFLFIVLAYTGRIKSRIKASIFKWLMWLMAVVFLINTLGNLLAKTSTETLIFTPVTFVSAVCCLVLLSKEKS